MSDPFVVLAQVAPIFVIIGFIVYGLAQIPKDKWNIFFKFILDTYNKLTKKEEKKEIDPIQQFRIQNKIE